MFPVVNVISFSPLDQQLLRFLPLDHVMELTCHLFKMVQFDFEEGNLESGFGITIVCYRHVRTSVSFRNQ